VFKSNDFGLTWIKVPGVFAITISAYDFDHYVYIDHFGKEHENFPSGAVLDNTPLEDLDPDNRPGLERTTSKPIVNEEPDYYDVFFNA
jgi:hypothetical protein